MPIKRHKIKITPLDEYGHCEVTIDGEQIHGVRSIQTSHAANEMPYADITILANAEVETFAEIGLRMDINCVQEAIKCLVFSMKLDPDLKNGVKMSVESVLRENMIDRPELAEAIVNRVFGLD